MSIVGIIPARAGSRRLPGKNMRPLKGKPLIAWTIETALKAGLDRVVVSTENAVIADTAIKAGAAAIIRPRELATDEAQSEDVVLHAAKALNLAPDDVLVLLQPTSPFRSEGTIRAGLLLHKQRSMPVVSVSTVAIARHTYAVVSGRMERADIVTPNGCLYIATVSYLRLYESFAFMAVPLSVEGDEALDIDTKDDWARAKAIVGESLTCTPYGEYLMGESA